MLIIKIKASLKCKKMRLLGKLVNFCIFYLTKNIKMLFNVYIMLFRCAFHHRSGNS